MKTVYFSVAMITQSYDPSEFEENPIKSKLTMHLFKIFSPSDVYDLVSVKITKETLENDDKFYSLGIIQ